MIKEREVRMQTFYATPIAKQCCRGRRSPSKWWPCSVGRGGRNRGTHKGDKRVLCLCLHWGGRGGTLEVTSCCSLLVLCWGHLVSWLKGEGCLPGGVGNVRERPSWYNERWRGEGGWGGEINKRRWLVWWGGEQWSVKLVWRPLRWQENESWKVKIWKFENLKI